MYNTSDKISYHDDHLVQLTASASECGVFPDIEKMKVNHILRKISENWLGKVSKKYQKINKKN